MSFGKRHTARAFAVQALYADEFKLRKEPENQSGFFDSFIWIDSKDETVKSYALLLYSGVNENKERIDQIISKNVKNRTIDQITLVDLCILRLAVYLFLYDGETDNNVIIDEAVKLSIEFSSEINYRFVNGVLDSISKNLIRENYVNNN